MPSLGGPGLKAAIRVASLLAVVAALRSSAGAAEEGRVALWLDGAEVSRLRPTITAALPRSVTVVRGARQTHRRRGEALTTTLDRVVKRLDALAALYVGVERIHGRQLLHVGWVLPEASSVDRQLLIAAQGKRRALREPLLSAISPFLRALPGQVEDRGPAAPESAAATRQETERFLGVVATLTAVVAPAAEADAADQAQPVALTQAPSSIEPTTAERPTLVAHPRRAHVAPPLLEVSADLEVGSHWFRYHEPISSFLTGTSIPAVPLVRAGLVLHPLAWTRLPVLRDLGVWADGERSLYARSKQSNGSGMVNNVWSGFDIGLRARVRMGGERAPIAGLSLAYGGLSFSFEDGAGSLVSGLPTVSYRYVRAGGELSAPLGRVVLCASGAYRAILSGGYLGSRFPHAQIGGMDVSVGAAVKVGRGFEARLTGEYVRMFYDLRPEPGDASVAGGALDEFTLAKVGLGYSF
jgi:hypothetical protein